MDSGRYFSTQGNCLSSIVIDVVLDDDEEEEEEEEEEDVVNVDIF